MGPGLCNRVISPGLLKRCSLYYRTDSGGPQKCWDGSAHPTLPRSAKMVCPNHTGRRSPIIFSEQDLAKSYFELHPRKVRPVQLELDQDLRPEPEEAKEEF